MLSTTIAMSRAWAMPSPDTFSIAPIAALLDRWLDGREIIIDPFARSGRRGTITNDLNPDTSAMFSKTAEDFTAGLAAAETIADAILFDPPYSPRQIKDCYQQVGRVVGQADTQSARLYRIVKDNLARCCRPGTVAICCGWNAMGFGKARGFELREILLVDHGGAHNATIVTVEVKREGELLGWMDRIDAEGK